MKKNIWLSGILLLLFSFPSNARPTDHVIVGRGYTKYHNSRNHYPSDHMDNVKVVKKFARNEK